MANNSRVTMLGYAILGLLAEGPKSGYDIAQLLKMPVSFFWTANHSQIYPELARLEDEGLVEYRVVEQHDRPDKKLHSITDAGLEKVRQWVALAPKPQPSRDELVLKAYFIWLADPARAAQLFREQERAHAAQLARHQRALEDATRLGGNGAPATSPEFGDYLTLLRGVGYEREYTEWCRSVAELLEARQHDTQ